jgi:hypothetical protein
MKQLARQAESQSWERAWPEFASLDCYACHHSLREPSWRQARDYSGTPGYPTLNDSRYRVFRQVVSQVSAESRQALDEKIHQLHSLMGHANGSRAEIAAKAQEIATLRSGFDLIKHLALRLRPKLRRLLHWPIS